ncbi:MAG: DNA polymerase III subunit epsilon [Alphaproteobacteria bacterium]|nr:DNA polymerase III subunit epsilon [Alphaproteobacteria bacterium]MCA0448397.1 DNA polymerase III subunit epsilon [Pseudomonadota bacterium]
MREIVLDTETTGLDPSKNRIVEIGAIELMNHVPTGLHFHKYINPEMDIPAEATNVHGITNARVAKEPVFAEIAAEFIEFAGDAKFVIHNAEFDMGFLNAEFARLGFEKMPMSRAIDTVRMARQKFPGSPASLDALCKRFEIDNTHRTLHGALLDADLLAKVYLELIGGRQSGMEFGGQKAAIEAAVAVKRVARPARPHAPSEAELAAHAAALAKLKAPVWMN